MKNENGIGVISNKNWLQKGEVAGHFGVVNLNQGAESTLSYLMARLTVGKYKD